MVRVREIQTFWVLNQHQGHISSKFMGLGTGKLKLACSNVTHHMSTALSSKGASVAAKKTCAGHSFFPPAMSLLFSNNPQQQWSNSTKLQSHIKIRPSLCQKISPQNKNNKNNSVSNISCCIDYNISTLLKKQNLKNELRSSRCLVWSWD